ncbi:MAG: hypothetical protein IPO92_11790 [Saprospiraceae bacterium]|nr:hypothetical protein [Saprospiraceae bacterium]
MDSSDNIYYMILESKGLGSNHHFNTHYLIQNDNLFRIDSTMNFSKLNNEIAGVTYLRNDIFILAVLTL